MRKKSKNRSRKTQRRKHFNRHHLLPRSRVVELLNEEVDIRLEITKNTKQKPHNDWHILFVKDTPDEAIEQIRKWTTKKGKLATNRLGKKRLKAWENLFGENTRPKEAIEIVKKEWSIPSEVVWRLLKLLLPKEAIELLKKSNILRRP